MGLGARVLYTRGIIVVLISVCGVSPGVARGESSLRPMGLSAPGLDARDPAVAVDGSGVATVVWQRSQVVQARQIASDGTLGPVWDLGGPGVVQQVAVDGLGSATVVWQSPAAVGIPPTVHARRIAPDGSLGPTLDLSAPGQVAGYPVLANDSVGTTTVVWEGDQIQARRIAPDGTLGPILNLTTTEEEANGATMGVDRNGTATAVWLSSLRSGFVIRTRRIAADGTLDSARDVFVTPAALYQSAPVVAVDPAGGATVVRERDTTANTTFLQARRISSNGALGPIRNASAPVRRIALLPRLTVVRSGATIVVWQASLGRRPIIQARRIARSGRMSHIRRWRTGPSALGPQVAVDGEAGAAVAVWHNGRSTANSTGTIQARRIASDGSMGPIRNLSARGTPAYDPAVAVGATDTAAAVWTQPNGSNQITEGRQFRYR